MVILVVSSFEAFLPEFYMPILVSPSMFPTILILHSLITTKTGWGIQIMKLFDSVGFWCWCIAVQIIEFFDFVHCPVFFKIMLWKLDVSIFRCGTPTLLDMLEGATDWGMLCLTDPTELVPPAPKMEKDAFSKTLCFKKYWMMDKVQKLNNPNMKLSVNFFFPFPW